MPAAPFALPLSDSATPDCLPPWADWEEGGVQRRQPRARGLGHRLGGQDDGALEHVGQLVVVARFGQLQGTSRQTDCLAHRGDLSAWFSLARRHTGQGHYPV